MILCQVTILLVFTFVDPARETEVTECSGASMVQRAICESETDLLFIVKMIFEASILLAGCILAYKTHDLDSQIGELLLAMYNIALVGVIVVVLVQFADMKSNGQKSHSCRRHFLGFCD
jgi:hypothetical protein